MPGNLPLAGLLEFAKVINAPRLAWFDADRACSDGARCDSPGAQRLDQIFGLRRVAHLADGACDVGEDRPVLARQSVAIIEFPGNLIEPTQINGSGRDFGDLRVGAHFDQAHCPVLPLLPDLRQPSVVRRT